MSPEDIKKLLGGYATGTLTAEEQQALFAAALEDQELFDALAREQSLRDLLRDPAARAELLSALDTPASRPGRFLAMAAPSRGRRVGDGGRRRHRDSGGLAGHARRSVKPAEPVIVAELKRQEPEPALSPAQPDASTRAKIAQDAPAAGMADKKAVPAMAPPPGPVGHSGLERAQGRKPMSPPPRWRRHLRLRPQRPCLP